MSHLTRTRALIAVGTVLTTVALALVVRSSIGGTPDGWRTVGSGLLALVGLAGLVAAAWQIRSRPPVDQPEASTGQYRRAGRYRLVESPPEGTGLSSPLAGHETAALFARAGETARASGSVEAGVDIARPALRDLATAVLVAGGASQAAAERAIDAGSWTDDREAAALLSEAVDPPPAPFRQRLRAWLRPGRAARERIDRTAAALAASAEATMPTVAGRDAPRRVRVSPPPLAALERDVDGTLRRARADGRADRGSAGRPPTEGHDGTEPSGPGGEP